MDDEKPELTTPIEDSEAWYSRKRETLEKAYLKGESPWEQSGFKGTYERWEILRQPVAEAVSRSGSFLDIGCANGFLLQCLLKWLAPKQVLIEPFGLDMSSALIELAKQRFPKRTQNFWLGNCCSWKPLRPFDYVRVELEYVRHEDRKALLIAIRDSYLTSRGQLLLTEYRPSRFAHDQLWTYETIFGQQAIGLPCFSAFDGEVELTRVAILGAGDLNNL